MGCISSTKPLAELNLVEHGKLRGRAFPLLKETVRLSTERCTVALWVGANKVSEQTCKVPQYEIKVQVEETDQKDHKPIHSMSICLLDQRELNLSERFRANSHANLGAVAASITGPYVLHALGLPALGGF